MHVRQILKLDPEERANKLKRCDGDVSTSANVPFALSVRAAESRAWSEAGGGGGGAEGSCSGAGRGRVEDGGGGRLEVKRQQGRV